MEYKILLYYKYVDIADPERFKEEHFELCQRLGLKGRIIVAHEGLNATAEGTSEAIDEYMEVLKADKRFEDVHFKVSEGTGSAFPKLSIKVRSEIVSADLGSVDLNPNRITGKYLYADELYEWFESGKEFYIVDMRNDYEHKVGLFEGSIPAVFGNFRDLPKVLEQIDHLRDKTVLTVCTGGVRCEKASGFLVEHGFKDVYQLFGGIVTFMERYPNRYFNGKLYVFDGRITMGFNVDSPEHTVIGRCDKCNATSDNYVNCGNPRCNKHFLCCESCKSEKIAYCSNECEEVHQAKLAESIEADTQGSQSV